MSAQRENLAEQINKIRVDITYILDQIKQLKGRQLRLPSSLRRLIIGPQQNMRRNPRGAGRKRSAPVLDGEINALEELRAYLHAEWIKLRSDEVFAVGSGADRLAVLGIIATSALPERKVGRPSGRHIIGPSLRFWVDLIRYRNQAINKKVTVRDVLIEAEMIIKERHKSTFTARESDYYAELRRIGKIRHRP